MLTSTLAAILAAAIAQTTDSRAKESPAAESEAAKTRAAERLAFMKKSVAIYDLELTTDPHAEQSH